MSAHFRQLNEELDIGARDTRFETIRLMFVISVDMTSFADWHLN